jgi:hypothetical protein
MPPKVENKRITCTVSFNHPLWKKFRGICVRDGISASHCFESFFRTILTSMKAGDDLGAELRLMLALYTQHKHDNYDIDSEAFRGMKHE